MSGRTENIMRKHLICISIALAFCSSLPRASAQGTAFTYQGRLTDGGNPANGSYDLRFGLFDVTNDPVGGLLTNSATAVSNGLFTVTLDFGNQFPGGARLLEIAARTNGGGAFITLTPRQPLDPTPYSIYSENAAQLGGQSSTAYVSKGGDTMTGALNLPLGGLAVGGTQLVAAGGGAVGIGTASPASELSVAGGADFSGFVGINRTSPITGADLFDISSPYGGFGGMYINTPVGGEPFYGYSLGGSAQAWTYIDGFDANKWKLYDGGIQLTVTPSGYVGIGTTSPGEPLDIYNPGPSVARIYSGNAPNGAVLELREDAANTLLTGAINFNDAGNLGYGGQLGYGPNNGMTIRSGGAERARILPNGNFGIGTTSPGYPLDVAGRMQLQDGGGTAGLWFDTAFAPYGGALEDIGFFGVVDSTRFGFYGNDPRGGSGWGLTFDTVTGNVGIGTSTAYPTAKLQVNGNAQVCTLTIAGGCDVSEPFKLSNDDIPKGSLVVIDDTSTGILKLSATAYDTRVAGIVSGANGINPGISLQQPGINESGQNVALSGRVYALADATSDPIKPGDLLTTSCTPGHCMKVTDHARAQGAIIGKAMSGLQSGKGMVLVLVSLQ